MLGSRVVDTERRIKLLAIMFFPGGPVGDAISNHLLLFATPFDFMAEISKKIVSYRIDFITNYC